MERSKQMALIKFTQRYFAAMRQRIIEHLYKRYIFVDVLRR